MDYFLRIEKILKGVANSRRLAMINLLREHSRLSLVDIAERLNLNIKTTSAHLQCLAQTGLVKKKRVGSVVEHSLTTAGQAVWQRLKNLDKY